MTSMPSPRSRRTSLNAFEILFRLPGGRPGPGLVLFAKRPFASRFSSPRSVFFLAADGVWSALVRILSRSLSTACWAFVGTLGACAFRPSVLLEVTPAAAPPVEGDSPAGPLPEPVRGIGRGEAGARASASESLRGRDDIGSLSMSLIMFGHLSGAGNVLSGASWSCSGPVWFGEAGLR